MILVKPSMPLLSCKARTAGVPITYPRKKQTPVTAIRPVQAIRMKSAAMRMRSCLATSPLRKSHPVLNLAQSLHLPK
jgi:hypothetical protein